MRRIPLQAMAFLLAFSLLAACGQAGGFHGGHTTEEGGDLRETTSLGELPSFLNGQAEEMKQIYRLAAEHRDLLQWIPCYCGCGESVGHKSNLDCFIHEWKEEEHAVVWDDHATRCNTCLTIAVESVQMKMNGADIKDIRKAIDGKYIEGYAAPTDTPMPM